MCGNSEYTRVLHKVESKSRVADNPQERPGIMGILRDSTSVPKRKRINNTTLAYVAGILDGEGCFSASYETRDGVGRYPHLRVNIVNTNTDLMGMLVGLFGGKINKKPPGPLGRLMCFVWSPGNTKEFLKLMKPYVRIKRAQLEVALAYHSLPYGSTVKRVSLARTLRAVSQTYMGDDKVQAV